MTSARKARERRRAARGNAAGAVYQAPPDSVQDARLHAADKPGKHLWIMTAAWSVSDPQRAFDKSRTTEFDADDPYLLDGENVISIAGPGCFKCEREYTPELATKPCYGDVKNLM